MLSNGLLCAETGNEEMSIILRNQIEPTLR